MTERATEGRVPPQAINAEQAVLGAILLDDRAMDTAIEILVDKSSFYNTAHQEIFEAMHALYKRENPIDLITLSDELDRRGKLVDIGGRSYLADLSTSVATGANI